MMSKLYTTASTDSSIKVNDSSVFTQKWSQIQNNLSKMKQFATPRQTHSKTKDDQIEMSN